MVVATGVAHFETRFIKGGVAQVQGGVVIARRFDFGEGTDFSVRIRVCLSVEHRLPSVIPERPLVTWLVLRFSLSYDLHRIIKQNNIMKQETTCSYSGKSARFKRATGALIPNPHHHESYDIQLKPVKSEGEN